MKRQAVVIILILIAVIGSIVYLEYHIDKEEGINVYHMRGENFNSSTRLGSINVSPGLSNEIFNLSVVVLLMFFCVICFVLGGGLKLFKEDSETVQIASLEDIDG